jgi:hypothetical protein
MTLTRLTTAEKLIDYLQHRIALPDLVDWAETAMMDGDFEEKDYELLRDIVGRIGLSDVRAFGLTWEDCEDFLARLGYKVSVSVAQTPAGSF